MSVNVELMNSRTTLLGKGISLSKLPDSKQSRVSLSMMDLSVLGNETGRYLQEESYQNYGQRFRK